MQAVTLLAVLAGGLLLAKLAVLAIRWIYEYLQMLHLPSPKTKHWFLGHTDLALKPELQHRLFRQWADECGGIYRLRVVYKQIVIVSDPELVDKIISMERELTKGPAYRHLTALSSNCGYGNLISIKTEDPWWKIVRKGVAPAFAPSNVRRMCNLAALSAMRAVEYCKQHGKHGPVDIDNLAIMNTIDIIGKWGFNVDLGTLEGNQWLWPGEDITDLLTLGLQEAHLRMSNYIRRFFFWRPDIREGQHVVDKLVRLWERLLKHCQSQYGPEGPPADDHSFVAYLLRTRDPQGSPLPQGVMASQVGVAFAAGHDSTGHTISFAMYLLATHPEAMGKVLEELEQLGLLKTAVRPTPRTVEHEDLAKLVFLQAVIKETMRLYPVAPTVGRVHQGHRHPIRLANTTIPARAGVAMCLYTMQRRSFDRGDEFVPDRWLEGKAEYMPSATKSPAAKGGSTTGVVHVTAHAGGGAPDKPTLSAEASRPTPVKRFMPFFEGIRSCIGQPLAAVTMTTTLATMLGHLEFQLSPPGDSTKDVRITDERIITVRPVCLDGQKGLPMYVQSR